MKHEDIMIQTLASREISLFKEEYFSEVRLDLKQVQRCREISKYRELEDIARNQLIMQLRAEIYGIDHEPRKTVKYHKDWWESLKDRFAPQWFKKKNPVKFIEVWCGLSEIYPDLKFALPDEEPVVKYHVYERERFKYEDQTDSKN